MTATATEQSIGGLRWVVVSGPRLDVFRTLGELAREEIHDVIGRMPERPALERFVATSRGRAALDRLIITTSGAHPNEYAELGALAEGAGIDFDAILLANLRGDLGGDEGTGCSDLAWRRTRSVIAHNEDGAPALRGRFMLVTIAVDGEAPVTTQWYPGFLPSNTFTVTGHGLAWGINHLHVGAPAAAAGRHFVARGLQQATSLDAAIKFLSTHPSAGGFSYNLGEVATGRVVTVESAAGQVAVVEAEPVMHPFQWHTNHTRYLDREPTNRSNKSTDVELSVVDEAARSLGLPAESVARGRVIESLGLADSEPTPELFLDVLTSRAPNGVYRSAEHDDPLMTLCSVAVDLTAGEVTLQPRGGIRIRIPLTDLAAGRATETDTQLAL